MFRPEARHIDPEERDEAIRLFLGKPIPPDPEDDDLVWPSEENE